MIIEIKKLTETAMLPTRGSAFAAGYDLCADISSELNIAPGETKLIGTGLAAAIPTGYFGGIYARSGLSAKEGLRPANCVGVIDSDYRGEIKVALHNDSDKERTVVPGQRIAQLIIQAFEEVSFKETDTLSDTERGEGGYGSTGKTERE
ncbi:MAG: dUTP diphosphatase [Lachnospiraceae bacterium]|nr:dUTP diphosphatase [Lachnospiraceae bacterium]